MEPSPAPKPDAENAPPAVTSVIQRWRMDDLMEKASLTLRSLGCFFSFVSFLVMASNRHGGWMEFDNYEEFRYLVGVGVLGFLYCGLQVVRIGSRLAGRAKDLWSEKTAAMIDFAGDQVTAYFLISGLSAAIPRINQMRRGSDNIFTDSLSASVSMAFFAFLALSLSSLISGYKLSTQSYI